MRKLLKLISKDLKSVKGLIPDDCYDDLKTRLDKLKRQIEEYSRKGVTRDTLLKKSELVKLLRDKVISLCTDLGVKAMSEEKCDKCKDGYIEHIKKDMGGALQAYYSYCPYCVIPKKFKETYGSYLSSFTTALKKNVFEGKKETNLFIQGSKEKLYYHLYSYLYPKFEKNMVSTSKDYVPIVDDNFLTDQEFRDKFDDRPKKIFNQDLVVLLLNVRVSRHAGARLAVNNFLMERLREQKKTWVLFLQKVKEWSEGCCMVWPHASADRGNSDLDLVDQTLKSFNFKFMRVGKLLKKRPDKVDQTDTERLRI